jgi:signal transduction histidine kinase
MPASRPADAAPAGQDWLASSRLLAMIGHDLKAPLVTVQGFLDGLQAAARAGNWSQFNADVGRITRACEHMRLMLDELLELARDGNHPLTIEDVPLGEVVQAALDAVAGTIQSQHVTVQVAPHLPTVRGDRLRLTRVLQNLVDNALKSQRETPTPSIEIAAHREGPFVRVTVRDHGRGLDPTDLARIFELYRRLDPSMPGYGLGLWIVKQIVEAQGGQVGMESAGPGCGATAWFTVPAAAADGHPLASPCRTPTAS